MSLKAGLSSYAALALALWPLAAPVGAPSLHSPAGPPVPNAAAFVPGYSVTGVTKLDMGGPGPAEEAITAIGGPTQAGWFPTTVVLIAWDHASRHWRAVFNAAEQPSYQTGDQEGHKGPGLIAPGGTGPRVGVLHDLPGGRASLAYWTPMVDGNTTTWAIGIVNLAGGSARLWSTDVNIAHIEGYGVKPPGSLSPRVVGTAPHQELLVSAPWETPNDNQSYAVREYSFKVACAAWAGAQCSSYHQVDDTRSFVGIEALTYGFSPKGAKVVSVYPGSPAAGKLEPGDMVTAVKGAELPPDAKYLNGPPVIDQVALLYPGQECQLVVDRQGRYIDVPIRLGSWPAHVQQDIMTKSNVFNSM